MDHKSLEEFKKAQSENIRVIAYVNSDENFYDDERALFLLLTDHPKFQEFIIKARKKLKIPHNGFSTLEESHHWIHSKNKKGVRDVSENKKGVRDVSENILSEFSISPGLQFGTRLFIEDYLLNPNGSIFNTIINNENTNTDIKKALQGYFNKKIVALRKITAHQDRKLNTFLFNPGVDYLEITNFTSLRNLQDFWASYKKGNKEKRIFVPKVVYMQRYCWKMKGQKSDKDIYNDLKKIGLVSGKFGYHSVSKERSNYIKTLKKLRRI